MCVQERPCFIAGLRSGVIACSISAIYAVAYTVINNAMHEAWVWP